MFQSQHVTVLTVFHAGTYFFIADSYCFEQSVTAVQRSRESQRDETQQHSGRKTLHFPNESLIIVPEPPPRAAFMVSPLFVCPPNELCLLTVSQIFIPVVPLPR